MTDTGVPAPRPAEPYRVRDDGVKLYLYKSDKNVMIIQHPTGRPYAEARDPESATYTYTESDEPIPEPEEDEQKQKAEAFDYLIGGDNNE